MKKKNNRIFGIKTIDVNGMKVHTINIIINSSPIILNKTAIHEIKLSIKKLLKF